MDNKGSELNSFIIIDYDYEGSNGRVQSSTITSSVTDVSIYKEELKLINTVNVNYVSTKEIYEYTFIAINSGEVILKNVIIQDSLGPNIKFIYGSVKVNNCINGDVDITYGVDIGEILPGDVVKVSFKVNIIGVPIERKIFNKGKALYISEGIKDKQEGEVNYSIIESNSVVVNIISGDIKITLDSDTTVVKTEGNVHCKMMVENLVNIKSQDIRLFIGNSKDIKANPNSVSIDGIKIEKVDFYEGIALGDLEPREYHSIEYQVVISKYAKGQIKHMAFAEYNISSKSNHVVSNENKTSNLAVRILTVMEKYYMETDFYTNLRIRNPGEDIDVKGINMKVDILNYKYIKEEGITKALIYGEIRTIAAYINVKTKQIEFVETRDNLNQEIQIPKVVNEIGEISAIALKGKYYIDNHIKNIILKNIIKFEVNLI
ncbi:hypothetical protein [Clostridium sp.]|uniref:hypothetical protein n=1 Tax=Clostridium sp. TaxID=1506 RepID=UPI003216AA42